MNVRTIPHVTHLLHVLTLKVLMCACVMKVIPEMASTVQVRNGKVEGTALFLCLCLL